MTTSPAVSVTGGSPQEPLHTAADLPAMQSKIGGTGAVSTAREPNHTAARLRSICARYG